MFLKLLLPSNDFINENHWIIQVFPTFQVVFTSEGIVDTKVIAGKIPICHQCRGILMLGLWNRSLASCGKSAPRRLTSTDPSELQPSWKFLGVSQPPPCETVGHWPSSPLTQPIVNRGQWMSSSTWLLCCCWMT